MLVFMDIGQCLGSSCSHKANASGSWAGNGLLHWALLNSDIRTLARWRARALCRGWGVADTDFFPRFFVFLPVKPSSVKIATTSSI